MEKNQYEVQLKRLREVLGWDISQEELMQKIERVALHRPSKDTDDVVAASVGLPVEAVTIIREMIRALTGADNQKIRRICLSSARMRLQTGYDGFYRSDLDKQIVRNYCARYMKAHQDKEKMNEA